jgi:hypothetical protein
MAIAGVRSHLTSRNKPPSSLVGGRVVFSTLLKALYSGRQTRRSCISHGVHLRPVLCRESPLAAMPGAGSSRMQRVLSQLIQFGTEGNQIYARKLLNSPKNLCLLSKKFLIIADATSSESFCNSVLIASRSPHIEKSAKHQRPQKISESLAAQNKLRHR